MRITFLGTRANIAIRSHLHRRHSALMVETERGRVMFDCGADWEGAIHDLAPDAVFLTHAHPDHAAGLRSGAPCPVYASPETWRLLADYPVTRRRVIGSERRTSICGLTIRAYPLEHSLLAPALGYRVAHKKAAFLYCPDVVSISNADAALRGIGLYIGDGSSLTRPLVRRRGSALFGHTTIRAQLGWCARAGVSEAEFTHCGTEIVAADGRVIAAKVRRMGADRGVCARIAVDGRRLEL
jgi:phosphoribosyl 1,2-cyclic phosphodiesterase